MGHTRAMDASKRKRNKSSILIDNFIMDDENKPMDQTRELTDQDDLHQIRSLHDLINIITKGNRLELQPEEDAGLLDALPFPFLALVGQPDMRLGLLLSLINPLIGGVLLIGPRGTGKTTAVRGLINLLPQVPRSLCYYGCLPEDLETGGIDAVCPKCAKKFAEGEPISVMDEVRLIELPLNARLDDVIGGIDERSALNRQLRLRRGILALADRNILYIDEVNLLSNQIVDVILDAAAQGMYIVRRGPVKATYQSRFILIGSMNPEEGPLRPQIMDRFGLRIYVRGLNTSEDRLEAYKRVHAYMKEPRKIIEQYRHETELAKIEIQNARRLLVDVTLPEDIARRGLCLIENLKIDSLRAEITLFEAARAYAAFDNRDVVNLDDLRTVALMALRMRRTQFIERFSSEQLTEENEILTIIENVFDNPL